ncbi:MAG: hypothetical protein PSN34_11110 [Urechidicola sp.]|nr:hypothetical protein [Urechidicola sp.]
MKEFNVLVIDDKPKVLTAIKRECEQTLTVNNKQFRVNVETIKVDVEKVDGKFTIKNKTIKDIDKICRNPFDFILVDYAYANKESEKCMQDIIKEKGDSFTIDDLDNMLLTIRDLVNKTRENKRSNSKISKLFLEYNRTVILYTRNPKKFVKYFPPTEIKQRTTDRVFPNAKVIVINTSEQLFSRNFEDKYDLAYYAYLVSKYLEKLVEIEIYKKEFTHYKKTILKKYPKLLYLISVIGITLGAISEYSGGLLIDFVQDKEYPAAIILFFSIVVLVIIGGVFLFKFLEKKFNIMDL